MNFKGHFNRIVQKNSFDKLYPVWLWLATVICTPIVFCFWTDLTSKPDDNGGISSWLPLFIGFGIFFSLPAFFFVFLIHQSLRNVVRSVLLLKLVIVGVAIVGMMVTLDFIGGTMISSLMRAYAIGILVAGLLLKANKAAPNGQAEDSLLVDPRD